MFKVCQRCVDNDKDDERVRVRLAGQDGEQVDCFTCEAYDFRRMHV